MTNSYLIHEHDLEHERYKINALVRKVIYPVSLIYNSIKKFLNK